MDKILEFCKNSSKDTKFPEDVKRQILYMSTLCIIKRVKNSDLALDMIKRLIPIIDFNVKKLSKDETKYLKQIRIHPKYKKERLEYTAVPDPEKNVINWRNTKLENGWYIDNIPPNVYFYRGMTREGTYKNITKNPYIIGGYSTDGDVIPTYYTPDILVSNLYVNKSMKTNIQVSRTSKVLKLFKIDCIDNAKKLLNLAYNDEDENIYEDICCFYGLVKSPTIKTINNPEFTNFGRVSSHDNDFKVLNFICKLGFEGYSAGWMFSPAFFPPEIALCNPYKYLEVVSIVKTKKLLLNSDFEKLNTIILDQ